MRIGRLGGAVMALAVIGAGQQALANTWNVSCPGSGATTLALNGGAATDFGTDAGTATLCPFTSVPSAHVAGATFVSPAPVLSGSMASTTANQCLNF